MENISFVTRNEFTYHWCGKFSAENDEYIHLTRELYDFEFIFVTDGTLYIADDMKEYTVSTGEYLLMTPTPYQHGFKPSSCSFYWLHFGYNGERNDWENHIPGLEPKPGHIVIPRQGTLSSPERLIILLQHLRDCDKRFRESTLNRYICSAILAEIAAECGPGRNASKKETEKILVNRIKDYITWHIREPLKITEIADYFGYNPKYLTTLFREVTDTPLKKYLLTAKMEHAQSLLSGTEASILEISTETGFSDAHNFSNAFKKEVGLSPTEYRNLYSSRHVFDK